MAVISGEFGNGRIWLVQPDGSGATQLTSQPVRTDAQWSPDGTRVAFTGTDGDFNDVFVINDDGTGLLRLTNDGSSLLSAVVAGRLRSCCSPRCGW